MCAARPDSRRILEARVEPRDQRGARFRTTQDRLG